MLSRTRVVKNLKFEQNFQRDSNLGFKFLDFAKLHGSHDHKSQIYAKFQWDSCLFETSKPSRLTTHTPLHPPTHKN